MDNKKPLYRYKSLWFVALFILYTLVGFFLVPYFLKKQLTEISLSQLNSNIRVEKVHFNPFTIALDVTGIGLKDTDDTLWFSADKLHVNVNLWDTIFKYVSLDQLSIDNPHYYLILDDSTTDKIVYPKLTQSQSSEQSTEFKININTIDLNQGAVSYTENNINKQINLDFKQIRLHLNAFSTTDKDNSFVLSFTGNNNEKVNVDGHFNLVQSQFYLNWSLENMQTATVFHMIGNGDNRINGLGNHSGQFDAQGTVKSANAANLMPDLFISHFALHDFANLPQNSMQNPDYLFASIADLAINNATIDLNSQSISIEKIDSHNNDFAISFDADNTPILKPLILNPSENNQAATDNTWHYVINAININDSTLSLNKINDNGTNTGSKISGKINTNKLTFDSVQINNLTNADTQIIKINTQATVDNQGSLSVQSTLRLEPLSLSNTINAQAVDLSLWQAWMPASVPLKIVSGSLTFEQQLEYMNADISSNGWMKFNDVQLNDYNNKNLFSVNQLDLEQADIDSASKKISLGRIVLDNAKGDLIISEEQQLNLNSLSSSTTQESTDPQDSEWIIDIKQIELIDAQTQLIDKSIKPNFRTELSKVNGTISGLSSDNLSKADVALTGVLDTYAKLTVSGQINPLSEQAYTDILIKIENLNLQNLSSYGSQFLGFPITRGKVDFDLDYKLNQSLLKGANNLTFKQLQFGDKTDSKDALNLPLKLAVGLLTDGKGIMHIDLPVSGNIDDPEFSYGGLVFKAFFKLITGIVTSPFKLLGKLIPGGENLDLSGIRFQAGSTTLEQFEAEKLKAMQQILVQRPAILLELSGVVNSINDAKALQQQQLLALLGWPAKPDFATEFPMQPLQTLYSTTNSDEKWQEMLTQFSQDGVLNQQLLAENVWDALLQQQNIEDQLTQLAQQRAATIQAELIENYAVSKEKIFIKPSEISEQLYPQVKFGVAQ